MYATDVLPVPGAKLKWVDELPAELPGSTHFGPYLQTLPGDALFVVPGVGRFRVRSGCHIEIEVAAGCTREQAAAVARIAPFSALLLQRGELPLHASSVMRPSDGKVLLIAGMSGSGKSTTAAAFAKRGWKILNDDVSRLTLANDGALVWPGFQSLKLWEKSCHLLNIDSTSLPPTGEVKQKYLWSSETVDEARPLSAMVELRRTEDADDRLERVRGTAAVRILCEQTYRPRLVRALGLKEFHFQQVVQVAGKIPLYSFANSHRISPAELSVRLETVLG